LDVFPDHGVEAAAIINIFRTSGGFIVNYFQVSWAASSGPIVSFGSEAGIVAVLLGLACADFWRQVAREVSLATEILKSEMPTH
jgi:hypothetical protein